MAQQEMAVLVQRQAAKYGDRAALKYRDYARGEWIPITWKEFERAVRTAANALAALGVGEQENVGIFSQNKPECLMTDFAAFANRAVTIPLYATSSPLQVQYIVNDAAIRYLFVPRAALYLLVLYAYAGTILARWELPDGWVSWLVVALMAGVIAIEGGLYPSRIKAHRPTDERIARWLPLLALPLLVLMTVGIGRRFQDYGITLNRLYLVTLNGWFYFVCIGLIVNRARRLGWIPISFSLVFLMTSVLPVNYAGITRSVLHREVEEALTRSGRGLQLPLTDTQYEAWIKSLSPEEGQRINSKLGYLHSWFGQESVKDLVREDVSFHHMAAPEDAPDTEYLNFSPMDGTTVEIPSGHTRLTFIGQSTTLPLTAVLPVALDADTLCLPLDSLRRWEETRQPSLLRTTDGKAFVLTSVHLFIDHPRKEVEAKIEGYVFHND